MPLAGDSESVSSGAEVTVAPVERGPTETPRDRDAVPPGDGVYGAEPEADAQLVGASRFAGRLLVGIIVVLVGVAATSHSLSGVPPGLTSTGAMEAGAAASNLAAGQGLRTSVVYPAAVGLGQDPLKAPYLSAGPFFPALLAGYCRIRGDADLAVRLCAALGVFLCAGTAFYLAMRLIGPTGGALVGVVAMTSPVALDSVMVSGPLTWAMAWFTLSATLVIDIRLPAPDAETRPWAVVWPWTRLGLAGVCMGLCYLTLPGTLPLAVLLVAVVGAAAPANRRGAMLLTFAAPCVVCVVGWLGRNLVVAHNPFLNWTRLTPVINDQGVSALSLAQSPGSAAVFLLKATYAKSVYMGYTWRTMSANLSDAPGVAISALGALLLPFAVGAFLVRASTQAERRLRTVCVWAPLLMLAWGFFWPRGADSMAVAAPLAAVLAVGFLVPYLARLRRLVRAAAWCFVVLLAVGPVGGRTLMSGSPSLSPLAQTLVETRNKLPKDMLIVTDRPFDVAWFARYTAVQLPADKASLDKVLAAAGDHPVGYFLSAEVVNSASGRQLAVYKDLLSDTSLPEGLVSVPLAAPLGRLAVPNNVAPESRPATGAPGP